MGLDQWLYGVEYTRKNNKRVIIKTEEIYWRKANEIHKWFVDNIQKGKDDCGEYELDKKDLETLLDLCNCVLKDHSLSDVLLPTQEGFFFGPIDYDEYYYADILYTKQQIERLLNETKYDWFVYGSSW